MDVEKFNTWQSRGIFENSDDYQKWNGWKESIINCLRHIIASNLCKSSLPCEEEYSELLSYANQNKESTIHVVTHDMIENGASWIHLRVLRLLCPDYQINRQHSGIFYLLISDWLVYYCKLGESE